MSQSLSRGRVTTCLVVVALLCTGLLATPAAAAPTFRDKPYRTKPNPSVTIFGGGWGHGVGMSQYGAYAMAQAGKGYAGILKHYYPGIAVGDGEMPPRIRVGLHNALTFANVEAVSGTVPWRVCSASGTGCTLVRRQPEGSTWKVDQLTDGSFRLMSGTTQVWRGGAGKRLFGDFGPAGSVVRAYNPNGPRRLYRWGRLEFSTRSASAGTMYAVLDIGSVDLYLRGLGEVPSSWGTKGMAALKAQATTGRTYAVNMHRAFNGQRSDCRCSLLATPANQAYTGYEKEVEPYGNLWVKAVNQTTRKVATYNGSLISTFYSSSHGGRTENSQDSWAYSASFPYLRSVADPWSLDARSGNSLASWQATVSNAAFARFTGSGMAGVRSVKIRPGRTDGGSPKTLRVHGVDSSNRAKTVDRSGAKGIVGIDLRRAFSYRGVVTLSTLPSQQIRRFGLEPFRDDDGLAVEYAIVYAAQAGIMPPANATSFRPKVNVTRGQMATYLYRMLKIPATTNTYFDDVKGSPHAEAINAITAAGIRSGGTRREFRPNAEITRAQTATFLRKALQIAPSRANRFSDDNGSLHETSIDAVVGKRIMTGCGGGRFCPGRRVNRARMAAYLHRSVELFR